MSGLLAIAVGLLIAAAAAAVAAGRLSRRRKREAKLAERLETLRPEAAWEEVGGDLFGPQTGPRFIRVRLARAGLHLERRGAFAAALLAVLLALALAWLGHPILAAGLLASALAAAILLLQLAAARNTQALLRELPFLLDGVRQHLAVGASLQQALVRAVENAGPQVKRHFQPVVRRIQNGATTMEALVWLAERLDLPEIDMLAMAVQTNSRFGGAMSPTLANLTAILRDRERIARELRAATAETRLSGWVLAGLPMLALVFVIFANPSYAGFLTGTSTGRTMLGAALAFQAVGGVLMSRIMRLDF